MSSIIQSVIFNLHKWSNPSEKDLINAPRWSVIKAAQWIQEHEYKIKKVDITKNYLRFRQISPERLKKEGYIYYIVKK